MTRPIAPIAFLDTETITLEPGPDVIWEVGVITRDDDGQADQEWLFQLRPNLDRANPESLRISRYEERYKIGRGVQALAWAPPTLALEDFPAAQLSYGAAAHALHSLLKDRHVVGAVPNFDTERLGLFMRKHLRSSGSGPVAEYRDAWHYHLVDVEHLAVGSLVTRRLEFPGGLAADFDPWPPWDSDALTKALGLDPVPDDQRHTALGDCRWARSIWDTVMGVTS
jgi:hypothetical protein